MDLRFKCERKPFKWSEDSIKESLSDLIKDRIFFNKIQKHATHKEKFDNFD